jgi:hypothetical protein
MFFNGLTANEMSKILKNGLKISNIDELEGAIKSEKPDIRRRW